MLRKLDAQNPTATNVALLTIRLILAVVFMFHGAQKLFGMFGGGGLAGTAEAFGSMGIPLPMLSAILAGSAEFFGGLILALGVAARLAAIPMAFTMAVAAFHVHGGAFSLQHNGMEYALTLGIVLVAIAIAGPGDYTVARLFGGPQHDANGSTSTSTRHL